MKREMLKSDHGEICSKSFGGDVSFTVSQGIVPDAALSMSVARTS